MEDLAVYRSTLPLPGSSSVHVRAGVCVCLCVCARAVSTSVHIGHDRDRRKLAASVMTQYMSRCSCVILLSSSTCVLSA